MTAEWTAPITWAVDQLVTADNLNEQVRDNLEFLKDPPTDEYTLNEGSDYTTTSTSFVDIDATNLALTIETGGGDVLVHFHGVFGSVSGSGTAVAYLEVDVDGSPLAGNDGIIAIYIDDAADHFPLSFTQLIQGLSAGSHTFKLQWKRTTSASAVVALWAGAGTSNNDLHPQFWAREVS